MKTAGSLIQNNSVDDLTERISIFYQKTRVNERGDIIEVETDKRCEVWAKVLPISSRRFDDESLEAVNEISYRITVRYRNDILPDDFLKWRNKTLKQTAPPYDAESKKIWLILTCAEVLEDGATQSLQGQ